VAKIFLALRGSNSSRALLIDVYEYGRILSAAFALEGERRRRQ
jgi:hypothetical protein